MNEFKTELCEIFFKHRSDKCPQIFHSYSPKYYEYLKDKQETIKTVLEIGVGTNEIMNPICGENYEIGASLKSWAEFFYNAKIFAVDIDKEVLFQTDRIKCFYTDQSNEISLNESVLEIKKSENNLYLTFDLIIDDGSHLIDHMILSYETLSKYVSNNGFYIIEDIKYKDLNIFSNIKLDGFDIVYIHEGDFEWDSFIIYQKKNGF